ncbi:MAG: diacylglycerol kinase family protein [Solirubrobacterales bacterium]
MKRASAIISLAFTVLAAAIAISLAVAEFPHGVLVPILLVLAVGGLGSGLLHRGLRRLIGLSVAVVAVIALVAFILSESRLLENAVMVVCAVIALAAARRTFTARAALPPGPAPQHPALIYNPLSGGGKAERASLPEEARARGYDVVELQPGDDLRQLARAAVDRGADALSMAGGDGSQAIVAEMAAELGLPYACIPAGTRNHFALDLGVDRNDVVGALDAFVDGGERFIDLAEVNGRVFVNNVSLGLYADAVQRSGYREAKIRTLIDVMPDVLADDTESMQLRWIGPDGEERHAAAAMLVSNNAYRLGALIGAGTRPRIDLGTLGLVAIAPVTEVDGDRRLRAGWEEWSAPTLRVEADGPVVAGIDGEAAVLDPPLEFRIRPRALRVRIAHRHPGTSPSARFPQGLEEGLRSLAMIAAGIDDQTHNEEELR